MFLENTYLKKMEIDPEHQWYLAVAHLAQNQLQLTGFFLKKTPTLTLRKISLIDQIDHCVQVSSLGGAL